MRKVSVLAGLSPNKTHSVGIKVKSFSVVDDSILNSVEEAIEGIFSENFHARNIHIDSYDKGRTIIIEVSKVPDSITDSDLVLLEDEIADAIENSGGIVKSVRVFKSNSKISITWRVK